MSAIKKDELERLEKEYGLEEDGLSYQHRCSRIAAYLAGNGEEWEKPGPTEMAKHKAEMATEKGTPVTKVFGPDHPLYGVRLLLTPMMTPDRNRNLAFDEVIGHEIIVSEVNAGEMLYQANDAELDRMVGDYVIEREDPDRPIVAKTTFPKIGTEISYRPGIDLVPVVRGNDGQTGYIWSLPTMTRTFVYDGELYGVQLYGLKTLIQTIYPELIRNGTFAGKPMMSYVDGVTLVASIPQTTAVIKEQRRKEMADARAGLI